ncbi:sensor histidine kinase [Streptomyces sp. NPDC001741]|uniref:sensor histidine kinase n=1 Tax=Streptomyces sp. NPDC001741 TaxID=3364605 RepID=UPI0036A35CDA
MPARTASDQPEQAQGRLHRLNLVMILPLIVATGVLLVAMDSRTWWHAVVLGLGVAAAVVTFARWAAGDLSRVAVPCLAVAAPVWPVGALLIDSGTAFYGISFVGAHVIPQLRRRRGAAAVLLSGFVAAVGAAKLLTEGDDSGDLIKYLIVPVGVTAALTGLMFPNKRFYDVVADLEEAREREAELAVARERIRFASDLHDIQGHTLHVVKLKIALAQKLLHSDTGRVEEELREVHALIADTISQTKELAYAQRRLNLSAELENAKNLFEAAGIRVHVDRAAGFDGRPGELLGQVLRETTTNILRHAQADEVWITLSQSGITVVNDGVPDTPLPELRGLAALRERVVDNGGELLVEQEDGRFRTAAAFPAPRPGATSDNA